MSCYPLCVLLITYAVTVKGALGLHVRVTGPGCFPIPLGQVTGQESWSVRIAKLSTELCSHDQYRLEGSGDGNWAKQCTSAAARGHRLLKQAPDHLSQLMPALELYSSCAHPANLTLEVVAHSPVEAAKAGFSYTASSLSPQAHAVSTWGGSRRLQLEAALPLAPAAGVAQQPLANNTADLNGSGNSGSSNSTGQAGSSPAGGGSDPAGPSTAAGPAEAPAPAPDPSSNSSNVTQGQPPPQGRNPVCCCSGSNMIYAYDASLPYPACCCGSYHSCCTSGGSLLAGFCGGSGVCSIAIMIGLVLSSGAIVSLSTYWLWRRRRRDHARRRARQRTRETMGSPDDAEVAELSNMPESELPGKTVTSPTPEQLDTTRECPVCLESFKVAANNWCNFPCTPAHGICKPCLEDMIKHSSRNRRQRDIIQCPLCRKLAVGRVVGTDAGGASGAEQQQPEAQRSSAAEQQQPETELTSVGIPPATPEASESLAVAEGAAGHSAAAPGSSIEAAAEVPQARGPPEREAGGLPDAVGTRQQAADPVSMTAAEQSARSGRRVLL